MKKSQRILGLLLAAVLMLSLAACGGTATESDSKPESKPESTVSTADQSTTTTTAATTAATKATKATESDDDEEDIPTKKVVTKTTVVTTNYTGRTVKKTGIHNVLKAYCGGFNTKEQYLASAAYLVGGQIKDTFFENFIFLNSPSNTAYYHSKSTQERWIKNYVLKNMDKLEEAVGEIKTALGKPNYQVTAFMTLYYLPSSGEFGEVGGKTLDLSKVEDRVAAYKWLMDEYVTQINAKGYKNIKLIGYYWQEEGLKYADLDMIGQITDYARSKGYISIISPCFMAGGYNKCNDARFDLSSMQANYFPGGSPNAGGFDRLAQLNGQMKRYNLGVEMELETVDKTGVKAFKQYMQAGIQYGWIKNYHVWYICNGVPTLLSLSKNKDAYVQSAYTDVYKYVKGTLKEKDLHIE